MLSAVGCMLLIGCLNVSTCWLRGARHGRRKWPFAALSERSVPLDREQLTESVLICAAGGLAAFCCRYLLRGCSRMRGKTCPPRKASTSMAL